MCLERADVRGYDARGKLPMNNMLISINEFLSEIFSDIFCDQILTISCFEAFVAYQICT